MITLSLRTNQGASECLFEEGLRHHDLVLVMMGKNADVTNKIICSPDEGWSLKTLKEKAQSVESGDAYLIPKGTTPDDESIKPIWIGSSEI